MQRSIRPLREEETPIASELAQRVFDLFEAPDYTPQGVDTFHRFTAPHALTERLRNGTMEVWGAYHEELLVGVLATRDQSHISLLFVDPTYHRQGIARALFTHFRAHIHSTSTRQTITVNSSPYAVEAYLRLGFVPTDGERTVEGIRFTPMQYQT